MTWRRGSHRFSHAWSSKGSVMSTVSVPAPWHDGVGRTRVWCGVILPADLESGRIGGAPGLSAWLAGAFPDPLAINRAISLDDYDCPTPPRALREAIRHDGHHRGVWADQALRA